MFFLHLRQKNFNSTPMPSELVEIKKVKKIPEKEELQAIPTSLKIYDVRGRLVKTLMDESLMPGTYSVHWDGLDKNGEQISSGIYFYTIKAGEIIEMKKMLVLK